MDATPLRIQMLDSFSIRRGGGELSISGRSRKLCLLLAYLIWERKRPVPGEELIGLLRIARSPSALNTLKALVHRARASLDQLGQGTGRALLLSREGGYQWNWEHPLTLDAEEFFQLCQKSETAQGEARRLALRVQAMELYRGDFLPALGDYPWVAAKTGELRQRYLLTLLDTLPQLADQGRWQEVERLSGTAFSLEPCREDLCRWQMQALLQLDRRQEAAQLYEGLQERLLGQLGVLPSEELRELDRQARRSSDLHVISPAALLEQLQEPAPPGALICEYDFFCVVCHSITRIARRCGDPLHIALVSVTGQENAALSQHSLERAMDHLEGIILHCLRKGDTAARCSSSQFVLLLPRASYENSQTVCARITRAFARQFPHSPAALQTSVLPLLSASGY